jgi:hypothetical protein
VLFGRLLGEEAPPDQIVDALATQNVDQLGGQRLRALAGLGVGYEEPPAIEIELIPAGGEDLGMRLGSTAACSCRYRFGWP